jgi:hypothetical protein
VLDIQFSLHCGHHLNDSKLPFKEADGVLPSALPLVGTEIADKQM